MPIENIDLYVPGRLINAVDYLLYCKGGDRVRPTKEDMIQALQHTYEMDDQLFYATAPSGQRYVLDMNQREHVFCIDSGDTTAWIVWITLFSLGNLVYKFTNREEPDYYRTLSDGETILQVGVRTVYVDQG